MKIFYFNLKKDEKKLDRDFKIFMKTANDLKYIYTPENMKDKPIEVLKESINKFLLDD